MHKITSVIPTYNNLPFLKLTVKSVRQNCYYKDYEYIIDNSRKKLVEMFSYHNVGTYWYDFFANLSGVENE